MNRQKITSYPIMFFLILVMALAVGKAAAQLHWPVEPTNVDHPIGNSFGEFQEYGGAPYLHNGIDIREDPAPSGPWVQSVTGGTLTFTDNGATSRYNGVTIVNGATTYRYWHLDHNSITMAVRNAHTNGTPFPANTRISRIVDWTAALGNFHHLHFRMIRSGNCINPFSDPTTGGITPENDNAPPQVEKILICRNNSSTFLLKPATGCWVVDGDLDIIARASDTDPPPPAIAYQEHIGIYRIEYSIKELTGTGTHNVPATQLYRFDTFSLGTSGGEAEAAIIFKNTPPADSESEYGVLGGEQYYYIVTNVDGGGNLSEANGYWNTDGGGFPDGLYQISVTAYDFIGNHHTRSEIVFVKNNPTSPSPVEVFIRDRNGDDGSIPSNPNGEAFWRSPDIRVDAPPFGIVNATGLPFGPNDHDNPVYDEENRVYVRVHNLGCGTSGDVTIRFYWANPSGGIPPSEWDEIQPAVTKVVSGVPPHGSVEYTPPISWTPTGTAIGHRCLLVRLESTQDPIVSDYNVPGENNIAQKNVNIVNPTPGEWSPSEFFITNPFEKSADIHLTIDRRNYPNPFGLILVVPYAPRLFKMLRELEGIKIEFKEKEELIEVGIFCEKVTLPGFFLYPGKRLLAKILFVLPDEMDVRKTYTVDITQIVNGIVTGGLTFVVPGIPGGGPCPTPGDVTNDGTVSALDASTILQFVVGLIDGLPISILSSPATDNLRSYDVSIPNLSIASGQRIEVPVIINDATGVSAGAFSLRYDAELLRPVMASATPILSGYYWDSNLNLGGRYVEKSSGKSAMEGEIRIAFAGAKAASGKGALFLIEFEALPNTDGRTSPIIIDLAQLAESDVTKNHGSVRILPSETLLLQNYPNPFNPETWLPYKLAQDARVDISIYDMHGTLVRTLRLGDLPAGVYVTRGQAAFWNGKNEFGERVSSGVYFYTIRAGEFTATRRMIIVK